MAIDNKYQKVGENIKFWLENDGVLTLVIDTKKEIGLSKSGKMMGIASTEGFTHLVNDLKLNLWLGKKK